jgi:hypothetical protein
MAGWAKMLYAPFGEKEEVFGDVECLAVFADDVEHWA